MFSRSGWSLVRSAWLAMGGTLKKRPSLHLHRVPTWSNKVSPWSLQMALLYRPASLSYLILSLYEHHYISWKYYITSSEKW
jgi:hypothetical protein